LGRYRATLSRMRRDGGLSRCRMDVLRWRNDYKTKVTKVRYGGGKEGLGGHIG
jgi:hypothetical protein